MPSLDVRSVIYDAHSIALYTLCLTFIGQVKMEKFVHCEVFFFFFFFYNCTRLIFSHVCQFPSV